MFNNKTIRLGLVFGILLFLTPMLEIGQDATPGFAGSKPALAASNAPVLLVYNDSYASNKFGRFLGEIMKTEGFNLFDTTQLSSVTALASLNSYDTVVLAETTLTSSQASVFTQYVQGGGNLIAMRPDSQLASLFGLGSSAGTLNNPYIAIQNGNSYGQGLPSDTLQTHATATKYNVTSAQKIALLYNNATSSTSYPAVTVNTAGSGKAVAFTYDLATSVVYLRQGNPNQTDVDSDGDGIVRIVDMYYNWIDLNKMPLPQADIQQRLFGRILGLLNTSKKPLPRFWYFPNAKNTTIVLTSDAHANPDSFFQTVIDGMQQFGYSTTFYMAQAGQPDPANLPGWENQGFTFSIHPYKVDTTLDVGYNNVDDWFDMRYGTRDSQTVRIHRLQWQGWVDAAKIGVAHNMAMDYTPYRYGDWLQTNGNWVPGYMTGSGMPMKFIDQSGQIVNNFGQYTEIADDQLLWTGPENLSQDDALQFTKDSIDASEAGNNEAIAFQMHVDDFGGEGTWTEGTLGYIQSLGLPVFNGDAWLAFTQNRYNSNFSNFSWNSNQLGFSVNIPASQSGQTIMLPAVSGSTTLSTIKLNGNFVGYSTRVVRGETFAFLTLPGGVSNIVATYETNADCNPLLVNNTNDTTPSGSCDTTLRKAINNAAASGGGTVSLNYARLSGSPIVITLTSPLTVSSKVNIYGITWDCSAGSPGLRLITSGTNYLQLAGSNTLKGLEIRSSGGGSKPALKTSGPGNKLLCTSVQSGS